MDVGLTKSDFKTLSALDNLSKLEWHQSIHARAHLTKGAPIAAIELLVRKKTGNPRLRVIPLFETRPHHGSAKAVWAFLSCCALFFVGSFRRWPRWLAYGLLVGSRTLTHCFSGLLRCSSGPESLGNRRQSSVRILALFRNLSGNPCLPVQPLVARPSPALPLLPSQLALRVTEGSSDALS